MKIKNSILLSSLLASTIYANPIPPKISDVLKEVTPPKIEKEKREIPKIKQEQISTPKGFEDDKKVKIERFLISGATHMSNEELKQIVAPYEKQDLSFNQIQEITTLITKIYRQKGYFVARAYIPEQNIYTQNGVLKINVIEGNYGEFKLENKSLVKDSILQSNLDDIKDKDIVSTNTLERAMLIINDTPGAVVTKADVRPGKEVGTSDFLIGTEAINRVNGYLIGDNYGSQYTGKHRIMAGVDINSPFNIGDKISAFGFTSEKEGLLSGKLAYDFPIHANGTRGEISYSKTTYELGSSYKELDAIGKNDSLTARVTYPILKTRVENLDSYVEVSYNKMKDEIQSVDSKVKKDSYTATTGLDYTKDSLVFNKNSQTRAAVSITFGKLNFNDKDDKETDKNGANTQGQFSKINLELGKDIDIFDSLKWSNTLQMQYALGNKNLDGSQDLSVGGINGVKFYQDGEESGENGYIYNTEFIYTLPIIAGIDNKISIFYDIGRVYMSKNITQEKSRTLQDIGLGYKVSYKNFFANSYLAYNIRNEVTSQDNYNSRAMFQVGYVF
ncbi:ShlB/FhaC/HecB family hemolysin secretion/activation protein [Aliarcobacter cryaerophilus]|uniref:ShlB/FhaC/HecB family hemolysin secretion/activation protein n=1 Tax=Aliarcobacter cryaerophilus TaxID=28198 RepID=UPI0021B52234|nr:ShlB/FhaC/HecB family hemolysin secretion/activation protein [Aliarcobacter cryaerophilus]MCT7515876.1 ShlB/FhaC/HecB family hemolysin secretion/activation protein [Aliarcobacter cryaerophilus]